MITNITVTDANGTPLDGPPRNFSNFQSGVWAVWNVSGSVTFQVTNALSYGNATLSGVFIGTDPPNQFSILQINAGGGTNGSWKADEYNSGGVTSTTSTPISTANVSNPAPQGVYQSQRTATNANPSLVYTIPNLVAGAPYTVYLHFAEIYWQSAGQRQFNVIINPNLVLQNFDIVAAAGCANCAIVKSFAAAADSNGNITIQFTKGSQDLPAINGIEIAPVQVSVLLPASGEWLTQNLGQSGTATLNSSPGIAASADYDADGLIDPTTFGTTNTSTTFPTFNVTLSSNGAMFPYYLGHPGGDIPVPGDYDGDGYVDFAVYRPSSDYTLDGSNPTANEWSYGSSKSQTTVNISVTLQSGDIPVPADLDGDGKTDILYFHPGTPATTPAFSFILSSSITAALPNGTLQTVGFGLTGDVPVVGDYDGDGHADLAVFRPSTGEWAYRLSSNPNLIRTQLTQGTYGDVPMPGDYDGDGRTDFAFWRPSNQTWYVILTSNPGHTFISAFGTANATPFSLAPYAKAPGVNLAARQTPNSLYTISGTVLTPGGAALPGVTITASARPYAVLQMVTDSAGAYSFTVPANSNLTLSLSLANYTFSSSPYSNTGGATLNGNVAQNFTACNGNSCGVTAGIYDDQNSPVTYTGSWTSNDDPNRYNGTQTFSNHQGDTASFSFSGPQVSYVYASQANLGNLQVSIDGISKAQPANLYSATEVGDQIMTYSDLGPGPHTITITVAGTKVSGSNDTYVVIDAFIVGDVTNCNFAGAYDDTDSAISYSSGWGGGGTGSLSLRYDGTQHYSQQAQSTATFNFIGTQVNYVYEMQNNAGMAQISIDGIVVTPQLDEYSATATGPKVASYPNLSNAKHTITVTALGTSNSQSTAAYVIVDAFITGKMVTISGNISAPAGGTTTVILGGGSSRGISQPGSNTLVSATIMGSGAYSFPVPAGPNYTVTPSLANATFSPAPQSLSDVLNDWAVPAFTATLNTITLNGTVNVNGSPTSGVTVTLSGTSSASTISGAQGTYSFPVQAGGAYTVTATEANVQFTQQTVPASATTSNVYGLDLNGTRSGSLNPSTPVKEYIFMNGQVIAIENPH